MSLAMIGAEAIPHPALRAVRAEAEALARLAETLDLDVVDEVVAAFHDAPLIVFAGSGKSGQVARRGAAALAAIGLPAIFLHPGDAMHGDIGVLPRAVAIVALSRGGRGDELARILRVAEAMDGFTALITAAPSGPLGRLADVVLPIPDLPEAWARVPTTSAAMQGAVCDALMVSYAERHELSEQVFERHHPGGTIGTCSKRGH